MEGEERARRRTVGCCILNWNAGDALTECVRALQNSSCQLDLDILVVDNASTDDSLATLARDLPAIPVLQTGRNLGYAAGNNRGAAVLLDRGCDFLLFINPDARVFPDAVQAFVDGLDRQATIGWIGSASVDPRGRVVDVAVARLPWVRQMTTARLTRLFVRESGPDRQETADGERFGVCGACVMFRADAFRQIGGFDEATFLYKEEYIVAERMRAKGWSALWLARPLYAHTVGLCTDLIPFARELHKIRSEQHLLKHYWRWPWAGRNALRLLRYADFAAFVVYRCLVRSRRPSRRQIAEKGRSAAAS